jgi:phosphoenolpyruvate phosphomutase
VMLSPEGTAALREAYRKRREADPEAPLHEAPRLRQAQLTDLIQTLIEEGQDVHAVDVYKGWTEVDTFDDYQRAWADLR